jgi:hypothetical protein
MDDYCPFCQHAYLFDIFRAVSVTDWGGTGTSLIAYINNMMQRQPYTCSAVVGEAKAARLLLDYFWTKLV